MQQKQSRIKEMDPKLFGKYQRFNAIGGSIEFPKTSMKMIISKHFTRPKQ